MMPLALSILHHGWTRTTRVGVRRGRAAAGLLRHGRGKSGAELRAALNLILTNATVVPYSSTAADTSDALRVLDEDPANTNNVILIYARRSEPKTTFGTTAGWNREHLWPNSYGIDSQGPSYSDLHNLRAADATVNSARGNKFFDLSNTNSSGYRVPGKPPCSGVASSLHEPLANAPWPNR